MFGNNLQLVIAAYNAGEEAVMKYGRRIRPTARPLLTFRKCWPLQQVPARGHAATPRG